MKLTAIAGCVLLLAIAGCSRLPGDPTPGDGYKSPEQVTNFAKLYGENCAGCHGDYGRKGAAYPLANPEYQAWVSDATLQNIIANGEQGTQMPAFARSAGGLLTDAQVSALVSGMRSQWRKSTTLAGAPPYAATLKGNPVNGQKVYKVACARCHEAGRQSITSPTYLALVNNQTLRTLIITGQPDIGQPDWKGDIPGQALTDQDVTDIVAYLDSLRSQTPGQPFPAAKQ